MSFASKPLPAPKLAEASFYNNDNKICVLTDEALFAACGLRIAFTERIGGTSTAPYASLNLGDHVKDELACVEENRLRLMRAMGVCGEDEAKLVVPNQVHGDVVLSVGDDVAATYAKAREGADGLVCTRPGVPVLLCFADCVPVVCVAPDGSFAVLHAGWRGAIADIAGQGLARLAHEAGFEPAQCNAYIGPHIGACCYETSQEILDRFVERYGSACDVGARHLDLGAAVKASLIEVGARPERICDSMSCTSCNNDRFFSYRADGGVTGRHAAFAYQREVGKR